MPQIKYVKCPDCGKKYGEGAPHHMFCEARTCDRCLVTFDRILTPHKNGVKLCDECETVEPDNKIPEEE